MPRARRTTPRRRQVIRQRNTSGAYTPQQLNRARREHGFGERATNTQIAAFLRDRDRSRRKK